MSKTIVHHLLFRNTTPKALYDLYMDARKHSAVTGGQAVISAKKGKKFSVHDGYINGKNLGLVKNRLIVQTWRAIDWQRTDADSVFILSFEPKGKDVLLHAVHTNVPDKHAASVNKGWHTYYWKPWKQFLAGKPIRKAGM